MMRNPSRRASSSQRLTREEALRLYTVNAAWLWGEQDRRGRLAPGMKADLAVLDQPHLDMPEDLIHTVHTVHADLTLLDGRVVHEI